MQFLCHSSLGSLMDSLMARATDVNNDKVEVYASGHPESHCYKYFIVEKAFEATYTAQEEFASEYNYGSGTTNCDL